METVEKLLEPICAACRKPLRELWAATSPRGFLICGDGNCQRWAATQGESIMYTGDQRAVRAEPAPPRPPRKRPVCAHCKQWLPVARRHQFIDGALRYCTLTCLRKGPA